MTMLSENITFESYQKLKQAQEVALKTQELLSTQGWCFWKCRNLNDEIIIVLRNDIRNNIPKGYTVYTEDELSELDRENIDEKDLRLIHTIKKNGAIILPSLQRNS